MKKAKRVIAIIMCCMVVLIEGITSHASVALPALPALPYIPPSRAKIWDILNNIWGLTGLPVSDEEKRAQAYEEMMLRYLTQAQIDEIIQGVRERRKYEIKAGVRDGLSQYMLYQVQTGYNEVITPDVVGAQETYNALMNWSKINSTMLPYSIWETFASRCNTKFGANNWIVYAVYAKSRPTSQYFTIVIGAVNKSWNMSYMANNSETGDGGIWYRTGYNKLANLEMWGLRNNYIYSTTSQAFNSNSFFENGRIETVGEYYGAQVTDKYSGKGASANRKPTAQSSEITDALAQGTDYPITKDTTLVNGAYDTTQTTTIDYPATDVIPATNVNDLAGVQEKLGVVPSPITQDLTDTVAQLQAQSVAQYGDTGQYALDLRNYFPFCIPFDIANLLGSFVADPQAPSFEWTFPIGIDKNTGEFLYVTQTIDLSAWDTVAYWVRKGELALFIVGLAVVTRQWFLRG